MSDTDNEGRCVRVTPVLAEGMVAPRRCVLEQAHVRRKLPHCYETPTGRQVYIGLTSEEQVLG